MPDVSRAYPVHHEKEKKRARKREGRASAPDPAAVGLVVENSSGARLPEWNRDIERPHRRMLPAFKSRE